MKSAASVKVGAAFLAGIVVALGGSLMYLKTTDSHAKPAILVSSIEDGGSMATDLSTPQQKPVAQSSAPASTPVAPPPATASKTDMVQKPSKPKLVLAKPRTTSRPVSLAVYHPPSPPAQEPITQELPAPSATQLPAPTTPVDIPAPAPTAPPAPQPHTVTIPAGTSLAVRLNEKLSTEHNFSGDTFRATLDAPIVMEGFIIADKGAKVLGRIVKSQKPGKFEGMAELSLTLTEISTTDGQRMHVETNESLRKGPSNTNEEVVKMGGGAVLGAIIGAIAGGGKGAAIGAGAGGAAGTGAVLLGHGKPAVIDNETRLTFALANATTLTEQLR